MDTEHICPSCRKPLPPNAPKGLCPECLMKAGFGTGAAPEPGQPSRTPAFVPPSAEELARLFPQFEILELLGQGGMGAVYKARQPALDRMVALKILPPEAGGDTGFADRFSREARALARLSHPNIVGVHEFGQAGGLHYFVMEYVEGLNLRQLEQVGKLSPREALKIIPQICEALQFAHDEGIVHRDIKPENVMVDKKGRVKITDFGLAKILGREPEAMRLTGAKDVMGTPHYMAPEQVEKPQEVDHRADIYSLGVVFYEMLTGELPLGKFQAPSRKVQVDVRLDEVVLHALEKEPERRYQQASQVKTDVEAIARTSPPADIGPNEVAEMRRHLLVKAGCFAFAAICFLIATVSFASTDQALAAVLSVVATVSFGIAAYRHFAGAQRVATAGGGAGVPGTRKVTPEVPLPPIAEPRFSRTAICGAVWAPWFLVAAAVFCFFATAVVKVPAGSPPPAPAWWPLILSLPLLIVGLSAPFGTTTLGAVAISQIRHSHGRLYGLGLAVFDVLLFPLLALNGGILAMWSWLADQVASEWIQQMGRASFSLLVVALMVGSCAVASWLITRWVWRAANRPSGSSQAAPSRPVYHEGSPFFAGPAWALGIIAGLVLMAGLIVWGYWERRSNANVPWSASQQQARAGSYDGKNAFAVQQKLLREVADRLEAADYRWDQLTVAIHYFVNPDLAECTIEGLRKLAGEGLQNGSPVQLFDALSGGLDIRHTGKGLWTVRGSGDLTDVNFVVDTASEMGPSQGEATDSAATSAQKKFMRRYGLEADLPGGEPKAPSGVPAVGEKPALLAQAVPGEYRVKLTNGVAFEVVAVASSPRSGSIWWGPDGALLADAPGDKMGEVPGLCPSGRSHAEFAVLVKGFEQALAEGEATLNFDPKPQSISVVDLQKGGVGVGKVNIIGFGAAPESLTCSLGLADGPWERIATWDQAGMLLNNASGGTLMLVRSGADGKSCLKLRHNVDASRFALRLTARLRDGAHKSAGICSVQYGTQHAAQTCAIIQGLEDSQVVAYELYRLPLRWAEIAGIATRPTVPPLESKQASGTPAPEASLESLTEAERARAVALFNDIEDFGHEFDAAFKTKNLAAAQTGTRRLLTLLTNFNTVVKGTGYEFPPSLVADVDKVRQALDKGDWDEVRQAAGFNAEYAREFRRISSRMVELAGREKGPAAGAFGPVIERVVAAKGDANKRFIDFDSGKLFAAVEFFGEKAEPSPAETQNWLRKTGIDAVGDLRAQYGGLVGFEVVAVPVPEAAWEHETASSLDSYLAAAKTGTPVTMSGAAGLPATFVIKTREGGKGLLQIVSLTTNGPPEVRIRYKLVQPARARSSAPPQAASAMLMSKPSELDGPNNATRRGGGRSGNTTHSAFERPFGVSSLSLQPLASAVGLGTGTLAGTRETQTRGSTARCAAATTLARSA